jgi:tRNA (guanine37-N1)-methyltransferase
VKFSVLTAFPQMIQEALSWGVIGRALEKNLFSLELLNPRDFTTDVHKTIDDRPFGGGDGMVMLYEPLSRAMDSKSELKSSRKIYLSPAGRKLTDAFVNELAQESHFTLLCGRYGGVDQRFLNEYHFENVSVGDYVVSGGELPALLLMDAIVRKRPGVLGNETSALADSFAQGPFFEAPLFTRPAQNQAGAVPALLLSGDHKKIEEFRSWIGQALTLQLRPEVGSSIDIKQLVSYLKKIPQAELLMLGLKTEFLNKLLGDSIGKN